MQLRPTLVQLLLAVATALCVACALDAACQWPAVRARAWGLCPQTGHPELGTLAKLARVWARSTGTSFGDRGRPRRRRQARKLDAWACVPLPDPPRVLLARFPHSGAEELSGLLAERADRNEFRHVRSLFNDSKRFIWHRFDEAAVVAAVTASSFAPGGRAVSAVVDASPELQADPVQARAVADRVAAVESRGLVASPALFYDDHTPLVDFYLHNKPQPAVVTAMRDASERFAAQYVAWRDGMAADYDEFGTRVRHEDRAPCVDRDATLNDCVDAVRRGARECHPASCGPGNVVTHILCGTHGDCAYPWRPAALKRALANLQYRVQGLTVIEFPATSLAMMERLLPVMFEHASIGPHTLPKQLPDAEAAQAQLQQLTRRNAQYLRETLNANDEAVYKAAVELFHTRAAACHVDVLA